MRHLGKARRAGVPVLAVAAALLATAGPAMADVTIDPPSAAQTTGANLTFHVTNTGTSPITRVRVALPADTAVAEVYPLSVPDWAPSLTEKHLATPLDTIHGGTPVSDATSAITWLAMPGKAIRPGGSADLPISLGPLPSTTSLQFLVTAAYADGKPGPAIPPAVLKLTPATAEQQAQAHAGHGGTGATEDPDAALFAQTVAAADSGPNWWSILGWVAATALAAIALVLILRNRRRDAGETGGTGEETGTAEAEPKEPVAAGRLRVSSWRYQDAPDDDA